MKSYIYFVVKMTKAGIIKDKINMSFINAGSGKMLFSPLTSCIMKRGKMEYVCLRGENESK